MKRVYRKEYYCDISSSDNFLVILTIYLSFCHNHRKLRNKDLPIHTQIDLNTLSSLKNPFQPNPSLPIHQLIIIPQDHRNPSPKKLSFFPHPTASESKNKNRNQMIQHHQHTKYFYIKYSKIRLKDHSKISHTSTLKFYIKLNHEKLHSTNKKVRTSPNKIRYRKNCNLFKTPTTL